MQKSMLEETTKKWKKNSEISQKCFNKLVNNTQEKMDNTYHDDNFLDKACDRHTNESYELYDFENKSPKKKIQTDQNFTGIVMIENLSIYENLQSSCNNESDENYNYNYNSLEEANNIIDVQEHAQDQIQ